MSADASFVQWQVIGRNEADSQTAGLAQNYAALADDGSQESVKREAAMMFSSAEKSFQDGDADESLKCSKAALSLFRSKGDKIPAQDSLFLVIKSYIAKGNIVAAESEIETGLAEFKGDKRGEAYMQLAKGEACIAKWAIADAKTSVMEAVSMFKDAKDTHMASSALLTMAKANLKQGDTESALNAAKEAVAIAKETSDTSGEATASLYAARVHVEGLQLVEAEMLAEAAVKGFKKLEDSHMQVAAMQMVCDVNIARENPRKAAAVAEDALVLCNKIGYTGGMGAALHATVFALLEKGEVKKAAKVAQDSLATFKATGNIKAEACAHCAMAYVHADQNELDYATSEVNAEIDILKTLGDSVGIAAAYLRIAGLQADNKQGSDAIASCETAVEMYKTLKDKRGEGIALYTAANTKIASKRYNEAASSIEDAMATFQEIGDKKWEARAAWLSGHLAIAKEESEEAQNKAAEAQELSDKVGDKKGVAAALLLSAEAYQSSGSDKDYTMAISQADASQKVCEAMDYKKGQAAALQTKARVYMLMGEAGKAIGAGKDGLAVCKRAQDKKGEQLMQRLVSDASISRSSEAKAEMQGADKATTKGKAITICRSLNDAIRQAKSAASSARFMGDKVQEAACLLALAQAEYEKGHLKKAYRSNMMANEVLAECDQSLEVTGGAQLICSAVRGVQTAGGQLDTDGGMSLYKPSIKSVSFLRADALAEAAVCVYNMGDDEMAEELASKAKDHAKSGKNDGAESVADDVLKAIQGGNQPEQDQMQMMLAMQQQQMAVVGAGSGAVAEAKGGLDVEWVRQTVGACVKATVVADDDDIHLDSPLMEMGMDSLSSVGFRNTLNAQVGMNLPAALMFDYPSQRAIVDHIVEQSKM